ncbi:hypothetical protein [Erythrobacter sp. JK5]|uniref:hypothetical protein n=1 Tax=Erythrobacter sp. JK5 TaxID=2829500 RepID=UPI00352FFD37
MRRFLPRSLLGQVMLVLALGLLIAQAISAVLLYQAAEQRRETAIVSSIAFRLIADGNRPERAERRRDQIERLRGRGIERDRPFPRRPNLGIERSAQSTIAPHEQRIAGYEAALRDVLDQQGVAAGRIAVTRRLASDDPYIRTLAEHRPRFAGPAWQDRAILLAAVERADQGGWVTVRVPEPRRRGGGLTTIVLQTAVILTVLVLLLFLVLRRITRPWRC